MPRTKSSQLDWHSGAWRDTTANGIERTLKRNRAEIAEAFGLQDPDDINSALEDLARELFRATAFVHEVDRTASEAQQRINLNAFLDRGDFSQDSVEKLDPATANRILAHFPGGWLAIQGKDLHTGRLRNAVLLAITELGPPRRGRPKHSDSLAVRQFALSLAHLYQIHTGDKPGRRVDWNTGKEFGPFRDFINVIYGLLPIEFQFYKSGRSKGIDRLVKLAVSEYSGALRRYKRDGNITHLWNIDDRLYLGHSLDSDLDNSGE